MRISDQVDRIARVWLARVQFELLHQTGIVWAGNPTQARAAPAAAQPRALALHAASRR